MTKRAALGPADSPSLFDGPAASAVVHALVTRALSVSEYHTAMLVTDCLHANIARCEFYLAQPLSSWDKRDEQIADVNASLVLLLRSCLEFLPADLRPLVNQFLGLRARVILRTVAGQAAQEPSRRIDTMEPEGLAPFFHGTYERLAPAFGYRTRKESAVPWEEVPENNRLLMMAVCERVLSYLRAHEEG